MKKLFEICHFASELFKYYFLIQNQAAFKNHLVKKCEEREKD